MNNPLLLKSFTLLTHRLFHLIWLIICLCAPWIAMAIAPYLWALVSLCVFYLSLPLLLLAALRLFFDRRDLTLRRQARTTLLLSSSSTLHLVLHLIWIVQTDWRF